MGKKTINYKDYLDALDLIDAYETQERINKASLFNLNDEIKLNNANGETYYFKEYNIKNDDVLISTEIDENNPDYDDYWVSYGIISSLPKGVIDYEINQKVRYGNEDVVLYFKGYNGDYTQILVSNVIDTSDEEYEESWEDAHMIHDNYKIRKGSNK